MWSVLNVCCPAGEWNQETGRIYIDSEAVIVKEDLGDMENILGFAATGDLEAMQDVFADEGSMVRHTSGSAVLTALPATPLIPQYYLLPFRWMAFRTRPSCWCGCALL